MKEETIGHGVSREEKIKKIKEIIANKDITPGCIVLDDCNVECIYYDGLPKGLIRKVIGHQVMIGDVLDWAKGKTYCEEDTNKCPSCGSNNIHYDSGDSDVCQNPYWECWGCDFNTEYGEKPLPPLFADNDSYYEKFEHNEPENVNIKDRGFYKPYKGDMFERIVYCSLYSGENTIFELYRELRKPIEQQSDELIDFVYRLTLLSE